MLETERNAMRQASNFPPELHARILEYNATHPLVGQLQRYGYVRDGERWKSPMQHGIAATTILPDRLTWVTYSESDAAAGLGTRPSRGSQCAAWGDAFALFCFYEHRGSMRNALRALEQEQ